MRIKTEDGFTLVELMVTMVVFVIAMVAASNIFTGILTQFKHQSSLAVSNIEGITGLELMRSDVEQAGFGLPWNFSGVGYSEAADTAKYDGTNLANAYNDSGNVPRAVVIGNNVLMNQSDVLVIKATTAATNAASQRWEYIVNNGSQPNMLRDWGGTLNPTELIANADHVIIIDPSTGTNIGNQKVLMNNGGFDVQLGNSAFSFNGGDPFYTPFEPPKNSFTAYIAYGVSPGPLRMPFNRADFYIKKPADIPSRCASGTGVLYKANVNHADGKLTEFPLLDCVLDMQVVLAVDTDSDGTADDWWDTLDPGLSAQNIRSQLKEIRIYLIVQEGQRDISYTYTNPSPMTDTDTGAECKGPNMVCVTNIEGAGYVRLVKAVTVPDRNYRWKLHTIVATPYNLQ